MWLSWGAAHPAPCLCPGNRTCRRAAWGAAGQPGLDLADVPLPGQGPLLRRQRHRLPQRRSDRLRGGRADHREAGRGHQVRSHDAGGGPVLGSSTVKAGKARASTAGSTPHSSASTPRPASLSTTSASARTCRRRAGWGTTTLAHAHSSAVHSSKVSGRPAQPSHSALNGPRHSSRRGSTRCQAWTLPGTASGGQTRRICGYQRSVAGGKNPPPVRAGSTAGSLTQMARSRSQDRAPGYALGACHGGHERGRNR